MKQPKNKLDTELQFRLMAKEKKSFLKKVRKNKTGMSKVLREFVQVYKLSNLGIYDTNKHISPCASTQNKNKNNL